MDGAEHFRAAEELLKPRDMQNMPGERSVMMAVAHALLANAAATAHATKMRAALWGAEEVKTKRTAKEARGDAFLDALGGSE